MPTNTAKLTEVTQVIVDKLELNKVTLNLLDVWYGDQRRIPRTPAAAVESAAVTRDLTGVGLQGRTTNIFTIYIMVYISKLQSHEITRLQADQKAEQIEAILNQDVTFGGTVIHGFVSVIEPGYATRQGETFRVARITWQGQTKTNIA